MSGIDDQRSLSPRLLVATGAVTLALGIWGFARFDPSGTVVTHTYRTAQLFVLETGDASGPLPWQLEVARYAAAAITAASITLAILTLSRERVDRWRAGRARDHVIVCGLGRRGLRAAVALRDSGERVVVIELDGRAGGVAACRRERIPVIVGDARDPEVLRRAGTGGAAHLVVMISDVDVGGAVALAAISAVSTPRPHPLRMHLEVDDPRLAALVRAVNLSARHDPSWRLDELDLSATGGAVMLDQLSPWPITAPTAHVLVVGSTPLGVAVVRELVRRWHRRTDATGALTVTVLDADPGSPAWPIPPSGRTGIRMAHILDPAILDQLTAAYVCLPDETAALASALDLLGRRPDLPVLVSVERAASLAALLARSTPTLRWVRLDDLVLTRATLLNSTEERIARALHDFYRRTIGAAGGASSVPWDRLPESLRVSNRAQAAHIAAKLAVVGCTIVPDDGTPPDRLDPAEVELLGALEHERWVAERRAGGWSSGPRDPVHLTSPDLVPWDELDEEVRDIDRRFVAAIPDVLADAGLRVSRLANHPNVGTEIAPGRSVASDGAR